MAVSGCRQARRASGRELTIDPQLSGVQLRRSSAVRRIATPDREYFRRAGPADPGDSKCSPSARANFANVAARSARSRARPHRAGMPVSGRNQRVFARDPVAAQARDRHAADAAAGGRRTASWCETPSPSSSPPSCRPSSGPGRGSSSSTPAATSNTACAAMLLAHLLRLDAGLLPPPPDRRRDVAADQRPQLGAAAVRARHPQPAEHGAGVHDRHRADAAAVAAADAAGPAPLPAPADRGARWRAAASTAPAAPSRSSWGRCRPPSRRTWRASTSSSTTAWSRRASGRSAASMTST